jgi:hypothetical protein
VGGAHRVGTIDAREHGRWRARGQRLTSGAQRCGVVGSNWVQEGEAVRRDADTRARQYSAGRREFKWDSNNFKQIQF